MVVSSAAAVVVAIIIITPVANNTSAIPVALKTTTFSPIPTIAIAVSVHEIESSRKTLCTRKRAFCAKKNIIITDLGFGYWISELNKPARHYFLNICSGSQRMSPIKFYFDAISPYAWLAWRPLKDIAVRHAVRLEPVPVLFAGLLKANGQLGPAEIPRKRLWLIKDVMRRADSQGLRVLAPPTHPFNPLLALRVASMDMDIQTKHNLIQQLMDAAWQDGLDISNDAVVSKIASNVGLNGIQCVQAAHEDADLKNRLKVQTEEAVAAGVFGVPTTSVNGELFWGSEMDTMNHIESKIFGVDLINEAVYKRWENITPSAVRKR